MHLLEIENNLASNSRSLISGERITAITIHVEDWQISHICENAYKTDEY